MSYKVIVIVGPTAVGKTDLSIELAQKFNAEIISGDSMQVYRGLDIGTAKATSSERQDVIHHLIDVREVSENFTVADFVHDAKEQIKNKLKGQVANNCRWNRILFTSFARWISTWG